MSGVPYQSRPIRAGHSINTAQHPPSAVGDASRLSWIQSDDVTVGDQSATKTDVDVLIDRYGRLNTGNLPVDAEPRSDEVQQLIKVQHHNLNQNFRKTRSNCPRSRIEVRPTALLCYHAHANWALTFDLDL